METVQVFIRFRSNEKGELGPWTITPTTVAYQESQERYTFDRIFTPEVSQNEVFSVSAKPLLDQL